MHNLPKFHSHRCTERHYINALDSIIVNWLINLYVIYGNNFLYIYFLPIPLSFLRYMCIFESTMHRLQYLHDFPVSPHTVNQILTVTSTGILLFIDWSKTWNALTVCYTIGSVQALTILRMQSFDLRIIILSTLTWTWTIMNTLARVRRIVLRPRSVH